MSFILSLMVHEIAVILDECLSCLGSVRVAFRCLVYVVSMLLHLSVLCLERQLTVLCFICMSDRFPSEIGRL